MTANDQYQRLTTLLREVESLRSVGSLLSWDEEVMMPHAGAPFRAEQAGIIARLVHERFTSGEVGDLLGELEAADLCRDRESDPAVVLRELRRAYDRATRLPASLVEEMTRTAIMAHSVWVDARRQSHYPLFQEWLEKTIQLKRREAECYLGTSTRDGERLYDALLESYEPGETVANLNRVFASLRDPLIDLVGRIAASGKQAPIEILERKYPADRQTRFARAAAEQVGFDFSAGRLDISVHPFCSGIGPGDTRMTTRYDESFFGDAFFGVLHETGHCLYEQGLPKREHFGTALAEAVSLGIHESQSRMWENLVGRGRPFWKHFFPKAKAEFADVLGDVTLDQWLFACNDVRPSLIRTEADEATYNLHVLIRFELEQAMLCGDLSSADIPSAWNGRIKHYLGLDVPDDARGCLQDVHWSHGSIGYFPTYTLGNLYAAQFYQQAHHEITDLERHFTEGRFDVLLTWLRDKIHRHGQRYRAPELVQRVTGRPLSAEPLLSHLRQKAAEFYGI